MPPSPYDSRDFKISVFEMAKTGVIPVVGYFGPEMAETVVQAIFIAKEAMLKTRQEWATFLIDSNGGSVDHLNSIRSAMIESGLKFKGSVQSKARSAGFILLQYCHWRKALSNSELLFHFGGAGMSNDDLATVVEDTEWVIRYHKMRLDQVISDICQRSGLSKETVFDLGKYQKDILAEKAMEMGLLDEVINLIPKSERPPV
jgi:ATP-dependent protease ClpP protease subunit